MGTIFNGFDRSMCMERFATSLHSWSGLPYHFFHNAIKIHWPLKLWHPNDVAVNKVLHWECSYTISTTTFWTLIRIQQHISFSFSYPLYLKMEYHYLKLTQFFLIYIYIERERRNFNCKLKFHCEHEDSRERATCHIHSE